jgi:murein DD-endopeptidase MepM/ murein hydrolase activator NlpD
MRDKQATIATLMRTMQKSDRTSPLVALLASQSFSEGLRDAQAIGLLQEQLTTDIAELRDIHNTVADKLEATGAKQEEIEARQKNLENRKLIVQDQQKSRAAVLQSTKNQEGVYQKQVAELQAQQAKIAAEVEAIDAALRGKINTNVLPDTGHGILGIPVEGGLAHITQGYGYTEFAKNGYQGQRHNGVDIGVPVGTPVYSAEAGTVIAAGNQDSFCPKGAYGKFIVISHKNGLTTLYGHLSQQVVSAGSSVERGQLIGYSGSTGYATGPHLHFTAYAQSTFYMGPSKVCGPMPFGGDVNPLNYL